MEKKYQPKTREELKALCDDLSINLGDIDTSLITDMSFLFSHSRRNNEQFEGIESWNVSNVKNMSFMFAGSSCNRSLDAWCVSNVEDMSYMFLLSGFNQPITRWKLDSLKRAENIFVDSKFKSSNFKVGFNPDVVTTGADLLSSLKFADMWDKAIRIVFSYDEVNDDFARLGRSLPYDYLTDIFAYDTVCNKLSEEIDNSQSMILFLSQRRIENDYDLYPEIERYTLENFFDLEKGIFYFDNKEHHYLDDFKKALEDSGVKYELKDYPARNIRNYRYKLIVGDDFIDLTLGDMIAINTSKIKDLIHDRLNNLKMGA